MKLEELMKPYFEKQEEIQDKYTVQKNFLEMRLERLRDNKEKEIAEYIDNSLSGDRNFYAGYGAMVKNDLEAEYARKEEEILAELKSVDKYYRVDIRELVHIKEDLRKKLFAEKRELELKLKEVQINSDLVILNIAKFKTEYDENYNIINGEERKKLFDRSHELIEVKYNIEKELKKVEEYLTLTQITKEETSILMMSMTPWEKEEYDRRKNANIKEESLIDVLKKYPTGVSKEDVEELVNSVSEKKIDEQDENIIQEENEKNEFTLSSEEEYNGENTNDEFIPLFEDEEYIDESIAEEEKTNDDVVAVVPVEEEKEYFDDNTIVADSFADLIKNVYAEILTSAKKLRAVRIDEENGKVISTKDINDEDYEYAGDLENVELPNGTYINEKDISKALNNYRKQNKGRKFKVKGYDQTFEINRKTIKKVKKILNDCSIVELLREKKLGSFDIKRVYGKVKADGYSKRVLMGKVKTNMPTGDYINVKEFAYTLREMFAEKSPSWLERFKQKITKKDPEIEYYPLDEEYFKTK